MKYLLILFSITILFSLVSSQKCECPGNECDNYGGTYPQCLCYCNEHVKDYKAGDYVTCAYTPNEMDSYCGICGPDTTPEEPFVGHLEKPSPNDDSDVRFKYYMCICPNGCDVNYLGTLDECKSFRDSRTDFFLNGIENFVYNPSGPFMNGECKCCGHVDPCVHQ
ncbi:hypothetical protein M0813_17731 [Anaeramoeba flamelloides]|uniref:Uncharacterized protein n=1 Tax=Anaeramoeba flamelloides TaxID=1746091 RepID=A0AAV7YYJ8_9EUKA|nr:hypothetical protein M0812_22765 [Anaeramoeba flamelloides]KAJ6248393.1 hypothetical protein M0813_17731 [Anaeramoeba flamelloides]